MAVQAQSKFVSSSLKLSLVSASIDFLLLLEALSPSTFGYAQIDSLVLQPPPSIWHSLQLDEYLQSAMSPFLGFFLTYTLPRLRVVASWINGPLCPFGLGGLEESNVDSFFEDVLLSGKPWTGVAPEVFSGSHVYVCAHESRDVRCGVCGPALIKKLNEEIELRGLKDQISVTACSHIGGHKYAGNVIIFSPETDGKTMGHWYGYVTPNDVSELLDQHIAKGEIIQRLWRGQMGQSVAIDKGADDQKVANGEDASKDKNNQIESENLRSEENVGCCQGANGVSCCRSESVERNNGIEEKPEEYTKKGSKVCCNWPVLQQRDILTAVGVVGAVAVVAVAYKLYRRA
ncbi:unnamed protein product [Sphenostylis stenocarpa]|uniref:Uncharacterized protein n=1 Tax=Sphenostylis stenocarpa TaxID=92480 RepID=A0AA86V8B8_9FABA|nr:unnamed protein product [Sphenostylis stenocarpa]